MPKGSYVGDHQEIWTNLEETPQNKALSLRFNGHFPGGPELAGARMCPFWVLFCWS